MIREPRARHNVAGRARRIGLGAVESQSPKEEQVAQKISNQAKESTESGSAEAVAFWSTIAIAALGAVLLLVFGRSGASEPAAATPADGGKVPELIEPLGDLESVPLRFVWKPSSDDVDLSQVIIFRSDVSRIWESAPTESSAVTIPRHAFDAVYSMEPCYWRVREVADGQPRAASPLKKFRIKNLPKNPQPVGKSAG
jgi:hypothetical protein